MGTNVISYACQTVEEGGVFFGQGVGVDDLGPDLLQLTLLF